MASITVTSPTSSSNWERGSTHNITWNKSLSGLEDFDYIELKLYRNGTSSGDYLSLITTIFSESANSYSWFLPTTLSADTDYYIEANMRYEEDEP
jgi:hypothetical protein